MEDSKEKPGWRTGQKRQKKHSKDNQFQTIKRNCSLKKLANCYFSELEIFLSLDLYPGASIEFLTKEFDIIFDLRHLILNEGGLSWQI